MSDCFKVPSEVTESAWSPELSPSDCSDDDEPSLGDVDVPPTPFLPPVLPPSPPAIPAIISMPACDYSPTEVHCPLGRSPDPLGGTLDSTGAPPAGLVPPPLLDPGPSPCGASRRSVRRRLPPGHLKDYVTDF